MADAFVRSMISNGSINFGHKHLVPLHEGAIAIEGENLRFRVELEFGGIGCSGN